MTYNPDYPYYPDLAVSNYYFFFRFVKYFLKGKSFNNVGTVKSALAEYFTCNFEHQLVINNGEYVIN